MIRLIRSRHFILPVLALCLVACTKEESREAGGLVKHTITAGIEGATKVQLDPEADTKVLWTKEEDVDVWVGETAYPFKGQNAAAKASTTFEGTAPAYLGTWVLVSPQGASTGKSGDVITATLPAVQTAVARGFDTNAAIVAGLGTGATVTCKHLYSGIRFKTGRPGVTAVTLKGNNGEKIAGTFSFSFSAGIPEVAGEGTEEEITLTAPDGSTFNPDSWYYILSLPCTFTKGVTLTSYAGSQIGTVSSENPFSRGIIRQVASLASAMTWETAIYYGSQNTFCTTVDDPVVDLPVEIEIDVTPKMIGENWQRTLTPAPYGTPKSAKILWGSATCTLSGTTLTVSSSSEGSSLIAIKDSNYPDDPKGTILWSFLIWVKSSFSETPLTNGKILLPPLGDNCYFQWGRKDPLLSDAQQLGNGSHGLENSIQNPSHFIKGAANAHDWFCGGDLGDQDATLWGGDSGPKTVWDPCPQGYRVPSEAEITSEPVSFYTPANGFQELGILGRNDQSLTVDFNSNHRSYWTRDVLAYGNASGLVITYYETDPSAIDFDGFERDQGLPLRCVRE